MNTEVKTTNVIQDLVSSLTGFPLWEVVQRLKNFFKRIQHILSPNGIYEVLDYESTLELKDPKGEQAAFHKREKVRYLQDNIIAYQDQAWGDGEVLLNYRATPGKAVDFYRPGQKTYIVISIRNVRNFGDQDEFLIEWNMKNCFLRAQELWETSIDHPTRRVKVNIIFPSSRPPLRVFIIEDSRKKGALLTDNNITLMLDGRWNVHWETDQVRQHERYMLLWDW